jgi:hypothetical protein
MRERTELDRRIVALRAAIRLIQQSRIAIVAIVQESRGSAESKSAERAQWYLDHCQIELECLTQKEIAG